MEFQAHPLWVFAGFFRVRVFQRKMGRFSRALYAVRCLFQKECTRIMENTYKKHMGNIWKQYRKHTHTQKHKKLTVFQRHPPTIVFFLTSNCLPKNLQSFQVISASRRAPTYLRRGVSAAGIICPGVFVSFNRFISPSSNFIPTKMRVHNNPTWSIGRGKFIYAASFFLNPISSVLGLMDILFNR